MPKNYIKALRNNFYVLATLTRDVICSKLWRDGANILAPSCQMNTFLISPITHKKTAKIFQKQFQKLY